MSAASAEGSPTIALLGDSIFDNGAYTRGEPDVVSHLRALLPAPWTATLHAVDGATTGGLAAQVARLPASASHVIVSIGGNDALGHTDLLTTRVASAAAAFAELAHRVDHFEAAYRAALGPVLARRRHTVVCTIYNGNLEAEAAKPARAALAVFNDVILRFAFEHALTAIDLRFVCCDAADYANPIEPSGTGGRKIAAAIARAVGALPAAPAARVHAPAGVR